MLAKIKNFSFEDNFILSVTFDEGRKVIYDLKDDIQNTPHFNQLETIPGFWKTCQLDESRTCITWNEYIDLPSDTIYEFGKTVN